MVPACSSYPGIGWCDVGGACLLSRCGLVLGGWDLLALVCCPGVGLGEV